MKRLTFGFAVSLISAASAARAQNPQAPAPTEPLGVGLEIGRAHV